ncbi:MAG: hypothetical protein AVDCRST_MAG39-2653, partial [uncultured Sphingomonadaceae bacterium]
DTRHGRVLQCCSYNAFQYSGSRARHLGDDARRLWSSWLLATPTFGIPGRAGRL